MIKEGLTSEVAFKQREKKVHMEEWKEHSRQKEQKIWRLLDGLVFPRISKETRGGRGESGRRCAVRGEEGTRYARTESSLKGHCKLIGYFKLGRKSKEQVSHDQTS